jgi:DUF1365 family protein
MKSCLFTGQLTHHRVRPARHTFRYPTAYFWLDLDELETLGRRLRLFGVNRRRVFSFYDADHLDGLGGSTRDKIEGRLGARGIDLRGGAIFLLTQCRLLGYVFNPVSFYYAHDATGTLRAIVAEVNNTFGERHLYVLADAEREPSEDRETAVYTAAKRLHVSPFLSTNAQYEFRFAPVGERLSVLIRECEGDTAMLDAHLWGRRRPLDDRTLAALALRHPLSTLKVTAAIHWQAVRLWRKGVPFYAHPGPVPVSASPEVRP